MNIQKQNKIKNTSKQPDIGGTRHPALKYDANLFIRACQEGKHHISVCTFPQKTCHDSGKLSRASYMDKQNMLCEASTIFIHLCSINSMHPKPPLSIHIKEYELTFI